MDSSVVFDVLHGAVHGSKLLGFSTIPGAAYLTRVTRDRAFVFLYRPRHSSNLVTIGQDVSNTAEDVHGNVVCDARSCQASSHVSQLPALKEGYWPVDIQSYPLHCTGHAVLAVSEPHRDCRSRVEELLQPNRTQCVSQFDQVASAERDEQTESHTQLPMPPDTTNPGALYLSQWVVVGSDLLIERYEFAPTVCAVAEEAATGSQQDGEVHVIDVSERVCAAPSRDARAQSGFCVCRVIRRNSPVDESRPNEGFLHCVNMVHTHSEHTRNSDSDTMQDSRRTGGGGSGGDGMNDCIRNSVGVHEGRRDDAQIMCLLHVFFCTSYPVLFPAAEGTGSRDTSTYAVTHDEQLACRQNPRPSTSITHCSSTCMRSPGPSFSADGGGSSSRAHSPERSRSVVPNGLCPPIARWRGGTTACAADDVQSCCSCCCCFLRTGVMHALCASCFSVDAIVHLRREDVRMHGVGYTRVPRCRRELLRHPCASRCIHYGTDGICGCNAYQEGKGDDDGCLAGNRTTQSNLYTSNSPVKCEGSQTWCAAEAACCCCTTTAAATTEIVATEANVASTTAAVDQSSYVAFITARTLTEHINGSQATWHLPKRSSTPCRPYNLIQADNSARKRSDFVPEYAVSTHSSASAAIQSAAHMQRAPEHETALHSRSGAGRQPTRTTARYTNCCRVKVNDAALKRQAIQVQECLFQHRANHVRVRAIAMTSLVSQHTTIYSAEVSLGWQSWAAACEDLCRAFIVNLLDEIVRYCECGRGAFYAAVACLDRFVAVSTDPLRCCYAFLYPRRSSGEEKEEHGIGGDGSSWLNGTAMRRNHIGCEHFYKSSYSFPDSSNNNSIGRSTGYNDTTNQNNCGNHKAISCEGVNYEGCARKECTHDVHSATCELPSATSAPAATVAQTRSFFTEVIAVCAMLGCKAADTHAPRVSNMLNCLRTEKNFTASDFVRLEQFVLRKLDYRLHTVTIDEAVGTVLYMLGGDELYKLSHSALYARLHEVHHARWQARPYRQLRRQKLQQQRGGLLNLDAMSWNERVYDGAAQHPPQSAEFGAHTGKNGLVHDRRHAESRAMHDTSCDGVSNVVPVYDFVSSTIVCATEESTDSVHVTGVDESMTAKTLHDTRAAAAAATSEHRQADRCDNNSADVNMIDASSTNNTYVNDCNDDYNSADVAGAGMHSSTGTRRGAISGAQDVSQLYRCKLRTLIAQRDVRAWRQVSYLAFFLCDQTIRGLRQEVIRARVNTTTAVPASLALQTSPVLVALMIVAVAAELNHVALPPSLLCLLPRRYQHNLRQRGLVMQERAACRAKGCLVDELTVVRACPTGLCEPGLQGNRSEDGSDLSNESSDACKQACLTDCSVTLSGEAANNAGRSTRPRVALFPVRESDDTYTLLRYFSWLMHVEYSLPRSCGGGSANDTRHGAHPSSCPCHISKEAEDCCDDEEDEMMSALLMTLREEILEQHNYARNVECDKILLRRYKNMKPPLN